MTPHQVIERLEALLVDERQAIRRIDGSTVEALALEKLALLGALDPNDLQSDRTTSNRFRAVANGLRDNAVILAHARNCLRDIVRLTAPPSPTTYGATGQLGNTGPGRLSITG